MDMTELKSLIDEQGKTFEAFKAVLDGEMKSKLSKDDPLIADKLGRIEKSLDAAVEAKAAMEIALAAERKEREDLEARINRLGVHANSQEEAKAILELNEFNQTLASLAASRNRVFSEIDAKGMTDYKSALNHWMRDGKEGLNGDEVKTLQVGIDPDGGYFVTPDMSGRIVTKVYETSPMRQESAVQMITTDALEGIEDLGEAGAGYAGEREQGSDSTTPQVGKWRIPVFWIDTEPKTTQQLLDDAAVDIEAWLSNKVSDKFGRFENAEFVAGSAGKIRGVTDYTTSADSGSGVAWGTFGHVVSGANGDFAASNPSDKLHDVVGTLKNEFLDNAKWFTRRQVITRVRKFKDGQGNYLWQPALTAGQPETLLGYAISRMEDFPALGTGSLSLAFGDMRRTYQIVDRQGVRVLRDQYTAKPYVKFYTTKRTGGGAINFEALKFIKFSAS